MDERNLIFMFYGFAAAYLILAGYLVSLIARERRIQRQIETVRKLIEAREKS
jgi:cell division protein FtsL